MIFKDKNERKIFIHIPKTGGNTVQKTFIENNMTNDKATKTLGQDGEDRFGIQGAETFHKHQRLFRYLNQNQELQSLSVVTCVRKPYERLISFYFAPFNWLKKDMKTGKLTLAPKAIFNEAEFISMAKRLIPGCYYLSTKSEKLLLPKKLSIIHCENLDNDFRRLFPGIPMSSRRNTSPYKEEARKALTSKELRKWVETQTRHKLDLTLFYG